MLELPLATAIPFTVIVDEGSDAVGVKAIEAVSCLTTIL